MQHPPNTRNMADQRIFISRDPSDAQDFLAPLQAAGAHVLAAPLIETVPVPFEPPPVDTYDWILITSQNAAHASLGQLNPEKPVAVIGPATAATVESLGFTAAFVPQTYHATAIAQAFLGIVAGAPLRIFWPCGNLAHPDLADLLRDGGMTVLPRVVYETRPMPELPAAIEAALVSGVDVLAFTSPSSIRSFHDRGLQTGAAAIVCIGPSTAKAARTVLGRCDRMADVHTLAGLADAVLAVHSPA